MHLGAMLILSEDLCQIIANNLKIMCFRMLPRFCQASRAMVSSFDKGAFMLTQYLDQRTTWRGSTGCMNVPGQCGCEDKIQSRLLLQASCLGTKRGVLLPSRAVFIFTQQKVKYYSHPCLDTLAYDGDSFRFPKADQHSDLQVLTLSFFGHLWI